MGKIFAVMFIIGGINMFYTEYFTLSYSAGIRIETNQVTDLLSIFLVLFGIYILYLELSKK